MVLVVEVLDENKPSHETDAFGCFVSEYVKCLYACPSEGHVCLL